MTGWLLISALLLTSELAIAESPLATPSPSHSPRLKPFKERLAAAETVQVQTNILGVKLDTSLDEAHRKLDSLGDSSKPSLEATKDAERDENERKVLWQLTKSDFSSVLVKTDDKERITYIAGFLRPGKEIPFTQIGQTEKAPILTDRTVAWDVVRPGQPLIRVVARGEKGKANSILVFVVKRPSIQQWPKEKAETSAE